VTDVEPLSGEFDTAPGFDLAGNKYEQGLLAFVTP